MFIARARGTGANYLMTDDAKRRLTDPVEIRSLTERFGSPVELDPVTLATFPTTGPAAGPTSLVADDEEEEDDYASDDM